MLRPYNPFPLHVTGLDPSGAFIDRRGGISWASASLISVLSGNHQQSVRSITGFINIHAPDCNGIWENVRDKGMVPDNGVDDISVVPGIQPSPCHWKNGSSLILRFISRENVTRAFDVAR